MSVSFRVIQSLSGFLCNYRKMILLGMYYATLMLKWDPNEIKMFLCILTPDFSAHRRKRICVSLLILMGVQKAGGDEMLMKMQRPAACLPSGCSRVEKRVNVTGSSGQITWKKLQEAEGQSAIHRAGTKWSSHRREIGTPALFAWQTSICAQRI